MLIFIDAPRMKFTGLAGMTSAYATSFDVRHRRIKTTTSQDVLPFRNAQHRTSGGWMNRILECAHRFHSLSF
jgi:hypothetical protein